jgi:hypothetical protein
MPLADRNILITPNRGASTEPTIRFTGADTSTSATITLRVLNSGTVGTLSFEGSAGQLFSLSDSFAGTIFSVNDVSGIPSIEVLDTGEIRMAQYNGFVDILSSTSATSTNSGALQVVGGVGIGGDLYVGGTIVGNVSGTITTSSTINTVLRTSTATHFLTFVDSNNSSASAENLYTTSSVAVNPGSGNVSLNTTPSTYRLDVNGTVRVSGILSAQQTISVTSATTNLDFSQYDHFLLNMTTNTTLTVSNLSYKIGCTGNILFRQDVTGGRTFTKATEMKTPLGGAAIAQVTSSNALSLLTYYVVDSSTAIVNYIGNFA